MYQTVTISVHSRIFIWMSNQSEKYVNVHQDLIELCREHNQEAQKKIYRLYYKAMYNTAKRMMKDAHLAEDIMQIAFLKAFRKIHTYNNTSSFGAWLKRIVINECINELRKNKAEYYTEEQYVFEQPDREVDRTEEWKRANLKKVKNALDELHDRYRTVINLILIEGYDLREVAEIMDITYANARVLYMRAKNSLQNLVLDEDE